MATTKTPIGKVKPIRGVDYWTEADKQEIRTEVDAAAEAANAAADKATASGTAANAAAQSANTAASLANSAAGEANTAAERAEASADACDAATEAANTAATNANAATQASAAQTEAAAHATTTANNAATTALDAASAAANTLDEAKAYTDAQVNALVGGAPETLNTLKEVSDALAANDTAMDALNSAIGAKADKTAATTTAAGLMSAADKVKLNGIAAEANKYTLPTASSTTLGGVKTTSTVTATTGMTPSPIIGGVPYYKDTTYSAASTSAGGLMSAADKTKLNGIEVIPAGATPCPLATKNPAGTSSGGAILLGYEIGVSASTSSGTFKYVFTIDGKVYGTTTLTVTAANSASWTHDHDGDLIKNLMQFQSAPAAYSTTPLVYFKNNPTLGDVTNGTALAVAWMGRIGMWRLP